VISLVIVAVVMGRRIGMIACLIGAVWMPEYRKEWALTLLALLLAEAFYQGGQAQRAKAEPVVTDQSQTLYSSKGEE
jgi:hypothetical protein